MIDFKASRELMQLPGGALGLAVGAEHRREKLDNPSLSGTENGTINSRYVAAKGDENIVAVFVEVAAPVLKTVELSGALRYDKYTSFKSTTPKLGAKWTPLKTFALRGTFSEGFRAPGPAESASTRSRPAPPACRSDPLPGRHAAPARHASDCPISFAGVKVGNPNLQPETSKGYTLGMVWDPLNNTSLSLDAWKIKRSNEINPLPNVGCRCDAGRTARRQQPGRRNGAIVPNTGTILMSRAPYRNSSFTEIKGVDLDIKQRLQAGRLRPRHGRPDLDPHRTWVRAESATRSYQYAGTHGNCDTSNCAGTPKDKISLVARGTRTTGT